MSSLELPRKSTPTEAPEGWRASLDLTYTNNDYGRPLRVLGPAYQQNANLEYRFVALGTLGFNSWLDLELSHPYTEWDTSAYARRDMVASTWLELGYIRFDYPEEVTNRWTHEVYSKLGFSGFLKPNIGVYHDLGPFRGWYVKAALNQRFALLDPGVHPLSVDLGGNVAWGDDNTIRRFFLRTDGKESASVIGAGLTGTLNVQLLQTGISSGTLSPYGTLLWRIASMGAPRTSWVLGVILNLGVETSQPRPSGL
jgi:hypothetical protein